ncbi:MAG: hypothetical protein O3A13_03475 [Proteobacteria bacterium]|nr:hypothetical protein [Pseudomonadota bacterium]MDA0992675.1 hypothetical protein [Pseudomonadota bacterium]
MNDLDATSITEFDWAGLLATVQISGLEFGIRIAIASATLWKRLVSPALFYRCRF